jgi:hypothetical protein
VSAEPRNDVEETLTRIWRDVLKIDDIGIDDDFFEIGGDSLLSIRVLARAGREGIRVSPEHFFERPTIRHMASAAAAAIDRASTARFGLAGFDAATLSTVAALLDEGEQS